LHRSADACTTGFPRQPFGEAAAGVVARIERIPLPISVHVRCGDYLNTGAAEFHGISVSRIIARRSAAFRARPDRGPNSPFFPNDPAAAEQMLNFVPK
jgi:hypothetical protein